MCPWWACWSIAFVCLAGGLLAGIWLGAAGELVSPEAAERSELFLDDDDDADPDWELSPFRFPLH